MSEGRFETEWRARFDRFAARGGTDATISGWSQHGLERRLEVVTRHVDRHLAPAAGTLLDLGCGSGVYCARFRSDGRDVVGADYSVGMLRRAKVVTEGSGIPLLAAGVAHLPFRNTVFAGLINVGVLQHLEDERAAMTEMHRVLKPEGLAFIDTLNKRSIHALVGGLVTLVGAWLRGRLEPKRHAVRRSAPALMRTAAELGFETIDVRGIYLFPWVFRWLERPLERLEAARRLRGSGSAFLFLANTILLIMKRRA